ncbi:SipW-dependent-type signal peptide-containing protein [Dietzia kunjamensis]|uniref:SipW-dependent-type signal peptide-containing protein n=1 Tax=Dietzia kunjamensis TaxID=322509 RepID=UPI003366CB86
MDATNPMTPQNQQKRQDSRRKRKAILAGGVVLGLGAAVTLAAWSDDVWADGLFTTGGTFLIEGSKDAIGGTQAFNAAQEEDDAIRLTFTTGTDAAALTPGDTLYAPFAIRLTASSTLDGQIEQLTAAADGPMAGALEYSITTGASTCNAAGASAATPTNGAAWVTAESVAGGSVTPAPTGIDLTANAAGTAGTTVQLCVAVSFPDTPEAKNAVGANPTADTSVTWDFYAEQDS